MEKVFFSVIVPVYNVKMYLGSCLDSILQQGFSDYEIIIVDDGSTDGSSEIADSYMLSHQEVIKVIHKENQGQISARREGLKASSGQYICFVYSDDCWTKTTLVDLYDAITQNASDIVFFRWERIDSYGKSLKSNTQWAFENSGLIEKEIVFEKLLSTTILNSLCTKCCRRELFDIDTDYSQYYDLSNGEDLIQSLPVLYNANSYYYLDKALYLYRVNTSSITHTYRKGQYKALNVTRPLLYKYIKLLGLDTTVNLERFYQIYLRLLWMSIEGIFKGYSIRKERITAIQELFDAEFATNSKKYLKKGVLPRSQVKGMTVFFTGDYDSLESYMRKYNALSKCKQCIISCLAWIKRRIINTLVH